MAFRLHAQPGAHSRGCATLAAALALCATALVPTIAEAQERALEAPDADAPAMPRAAGQFTTAVQDREPIDQVTFISNEVRKIFFFSDLRGLEGRSITHRWSYAGETMAEVSFEVRGPRWRVWSSKELRPDWIGDWTVEIVTDDGEVLAAETFTYSPPEA